jgi:hypothetical protein
MTKSTADEHYEEKFEFPLWKLIKQRAEEKDISYVKAAYEVLPEYGRGIRYRDAEFENAAIQKRQKELAELAKRKQREGKA